MTKQEGIKLKGFLSIVRQWKLAVHLLLHTRTFGVNNRWSVDFDSIFSSKNRGIRHIIGNYRAARLRATACGFLTREECRNLGWKSDI